MEASQVIAIDGPTASGKGTVANLVAEALGWNLLDSGSIYRMVALAAAKRGIEVTDEARLVPVATSLDASFVHGKIILEGEDVSVAVRLETTGNSASRIATLGGVREALLDRQRAFCRPPGLVADGRDMGSVVFPEAFLKVFLTASVESRADRRYKQLIAKGLPANIEDLRNDLKARDERDSTRAVAPLKPCDDAVFLDTTTLSIDEAVHFVLDLAKAKGVRIPF